MKILICSDSHGNDQALEEIYKKYPKCDLYLHAGDSESDEWSIRPFEAIQGNCDYRYDFSLRKIVDTPLGKLLIQHHPEIPRDIVIQYNIKIFVHGHTHIRKKIYDEENKLYIFNPGSISFSRDGHDLSFLILDIDKKNIKATFHSLLEK
ncbi:MAG: metallophosphoesterase family protein [Bacilli bacterium]|nr:metallophosphoesterase family protein [Bacilli bacterium]